MKRKLFLIFSALLLMLTLVACSSKVNSSSVLDKMQKRMESVESIEGQLDFCMELNADAEGFEIPFDIAFALSLETVMDAEKSKQDTHISGAMNVGVFGESVAQSLECYSTIDEDESVTYLYTEMEDSWIKQVDEVDEDMKFTGLDFSALKGLVELQDETKGFNGYDCYVLSGELDSKAMKKLVGEEQFESMEELFDMIEDSDAELEISVFVNEEDYSLVKLDVSLEDVEIETNGVTMELSEFSLVLSIHNVDRLDKIKVPKEAKNAEEVSDLTFDLSGFDIEGMLEDSFSVPDVPEVDLTEDFDDIIQELPEYTEDTTVVESIEVSTKDSVSEFPWTDMKFDFEGSSLGINVPYWDLEALGFSFDLAEYGVDEDYSLESGEYIYSTIYLDNPKYSTYDVSITIGLFNDSLERKKLKDCVVWAINVDVDGALEDGKDYPKMSVNGLRFGDSEEKVLKTLGEDYSDFYESESLGYKKYTYSVDYQDYFEVTVYPELGVSEMNLKRYP